jgi:ADP-heptose:LPS heptosyltransferase
MGDVLMCTAVLRQLKKINPMCRVVLYTGYRDVVEGLPFLDEVREDIDALPSHAIKMGYEHALSTRRHLVRVLGDSLGIRVPDVRPSCVVSAGCVERFRKDWSCFPRPWIIINRKAGPWTPNKDWPGSLWDELVDRLRKVCTVIEIGARDDATCSNASIDLRGATTRLEMVAAIAASDLHVGPISGPVHIAAAMGTPSVVIYGGYEHPSCSRYPGNVNLYSAVHCSPCWLRTPCPYDRACLSRIACDRVEAAIWRLWGKSSGRS